MRKRVQQRKFGRKRDQRQALLKGLAASLILRKKITTTEARAKEIRSLVEKLVTKAAKDDLATTRYLAARLPLVAAKKAKTLGKKYQDRPGGYLRIIKIPSQHKDKAKQAIIEFVE